MMAGIRHSRAGILAARHTIKPAGKGLLAAVSAFAMWGLFPLYFHTLRQISSSQVIAHRVVWSCLFVLAWLGIRGEMPTLRATLADRSVVWRLSVSATLVGVLQYIAPTLQFACGVFVLHEPFERTRSVGFTIIWAGLLIYIGEGLRLSGKQHASA
jgi:EamA domain-containing membrane protein RarD